jgi:Flp pilus assembly protein TadG
MTSANPLRNFISQTRGNMAVEAVLVLPMLAWVFIAFTVFWDAYRVKHLAQKATYTIADVISRERAQVRKQFVYSYLRLFRYAAEVPGNPNLTDYTTAPAVVRVTSVLFAKDENGDGSIGVLWSMSSDPGRMALHTNDTIETIKAQIPAMLDGDNIIVVESRLRWQPKFTAAMAASLIGPSTLGWMTERDIDVLTTVRPRFVPKVCFLDAVPGGGTVNVPCEL